MACYICVLFFPLYIGQVNAFYQDILAQPQALRDLVEYYRGHSDLLNRPDSLADTAPILTGMGASFHAAWIAALHFQRRGVFALAQEATDLVRAPALFRRFTPLIYVSQSGASAEVMPLVAIKGNEAVIAITNESTSSLGQAAEFMLPLVAGAEEYVATKTYVNSLAVLWMLVRAWCRCADGSEAETLGHIADRCESLLKDAETISARWLETFQGIEHIVFLGAGQHAATARQAAMMLAEWAKVPALSFSAGALRHGFIESVEEGTGIVLFVTPDAGYAATLALAEEVRAYGARVLLVSNGETYGLGDTRTENEAVDEFLAPILDVLPAQLFAEALARAKGIPEGFRYIGKVVSKL